jgi:hypothetical protein
LLGESVFSCSGEEAEDGIVLVTPESLAPADVFDDFRDAVAWWFLTAVSFF